MAETTKLNLRSKNIYQVFLRQHTKQGTFLSLIDDLERIKSLGIDYLYLMPIHPIGKVNRKGSFGSPYSVQDYKQTNPEYGTIEEFKTLVGKAKEIGLKIMLDMVFYQTSYDAQTSKTNPSFYYQENGIPKSKTENLDDVINFDFKNEKLADYLLDVLLFWLNLGVEAFRFDKASLIPLKFWKQIKKEVSLKYPDVVFLGESLKLKEIKNNRDHGLATLSDGELYEVFDILYDNDIYYHYENYLNDPTKLNSWLKAIETQESIYPHNYIKLRNLENHNTNRVASYINNNDKLLNLTALLAYLKGTMLIYAGQEYKNKVKSSLFEKEQINLKSNEKDLVDLLHRVGHLRKDELFQTGIFKINFQKEEVAVLSYENEMSIAYGIFNLGNSQNLIELNLKDGLYQNILYPNQVKIVNKKLKPSNKPMILFAMKKQI